MFPHDHYTIHPFDVELSVTKHKIVKRGSCFFSPLLPAVLPVSVFDLGVETENISTIMYTEIHSITLTTKTI